MRKSRVGAALAGNAPQSNCTFTEWVDAQKVLQMIQLREAQTIARSLDLATYQYGAALLMSDPAEVMLRQMYAQVVGCRAGSLSIAEILEELPGEHMVADLPGSIVLEMEERLSIMRKLEKYSTELAKR